MSTSRRRIPYRTHIITAISELNNRRGSSIRDIEKYIQQNHPSDDITPIGLKRAISRATDSGHIKSNGLDRSRFTLALTSASTRRSTRRRSLRRAGTRAGAGAGASASASASASVSRRTQTGYTTIKKWIKEKNVTKLTKLVTKECRATDKNIGDWITAANELYSTPREVKKYRREVNKNLTAKCIEQAWADNYLMPLINFMGNDWVFNDLISGVNVTGTGGRGTSRNLPLGKILRFFWRSLEKSAAESTEVFDPYTEYQVPGTNQFCQTFAHMNLTGKLPPIVEDRSWRRYYHYTIVALEYIKAVIQEYGPGRSLLRGLVPIPLQEIVSEDGNENPVTYGEIIKIIDICLLTPQICLNIVIT